MAINYADLPDGVYAEMHTSKGTITLFLEHEKTPLTVASFVGLAEGKFPNTAKPAGMPFFDGLAFFRVEPDLFIQSGDPDGNGRGGPGYRFVDEFCTDLQHNAPGILSMANAGYGGTNASQFFITRNAMPNLDRKHTVFGHVVDGQSVVDAIEEGDRIEKVRIIRNGERCQGYEPQLHSSFKIRTWFHS